jgi:hypothetical protein
LIKAAAAPCAIIRNSVTICGRTVAQPKQGLLGHMVDAELLPPIHPEFITYASVNLGNLILHPIASNYGTGP